MILKSYKRNGYKITEYTNDGVNISSVIKEFVGLEELPNVSDEEVIEPITENERILAELQYQTSLLEMSILGGIE